MEGFFFCIALLDFIEMSAEKVKCHTGRVIKALEL